MARIGREIDRAVVDGTVVTQNDSKTYVFVTRLPVINTLRTGTRIVHGSSKSPFHVYTRGRRMEGGGLSSGASSSRSRIVRYQRGARGSDFCVGNGRSNKISNVRQFSITRDLINLPRIDVGVPHLLPLSPSTTSLPHPSYSPYSPPPHSAHLFGRFSLPPFFPPRPHLHGFQLH